MQTKPHIYKVPGEGAWACSMLMDEKPTHGYGVSMRLAYLDWCLTVYGATFPKLE